MIALSSWNLSPGLQLRYETLLEALFLPINSNLPCVAIEYNTPSATILYAKAVSAVDHESLESIMDISQQPGRDTYIAIGQGYSWGRLQITKDLFQHLASRLNVFQAFAQVLFSYGIKTHVDERCFDGFRSCSPRDECIQSQHELCYNLRYVERHHRDLKDPWSVRQIAIYQQYDSASRMRCIILNPDTVCERLITSASEVTAPCCQLSFHAEMLVSRMCNWQEYAQELGAELLTHTTRACYSSFDKPDTHDYTAAYRQLQDLHQFQRKFDRALTALKSSIAIGRQCRRFLIVHEHNVRPRLAACRRCLDALQHHEQEAEEQVQYLDQLRLGTRDTVDLVSRVLTFRDEISLQSTHRNSNQTLGALVTLAQASRLHQEALTQLFALVKADGVLLKALSVLAAAYLPASLIATVYSSNLVQTVAPEDGQSPSHLAVSPQFWTYAAISIPLVLVTLLWTLILDRRVQQQALKMATK